jgi:hypothetical protein
MVSPKSFEDQLAEVLLIAITPVIVQAIKDILGNGGTIVKHT